MFSYTYQIIGGILIFISSLVGEEMSGRWKKRSYIIFGLLAVAYSWFGIHLDRRTSEEQGQLQQKIAGLQTSFDASETAREWERKAAEKVRSSDRDAFLKQLDSLANQISAVRANVQTEDLRSQLDATQRSLHETQQALESREVKLDVVVNGQINPTEVNSQRQTLGNANTSEFVVSFGLVNNSAEDAASGHIEIKIACTDCQGIRFVGVDPWPYWDHPNRLIAKDFFEIPKHSAANLGRAALISDTGSFPKQVRIGLRYRCLLCVPEEWRFVDVNLIG